MAETFLQYLTLPNPKTTSKTPGGGTSTKIPIVYGPYDVKPWRGVTWENLNASFGDVLREKMCEPDPRVRDAGDVASANTDIWKEASVTRLVRDWNERVVQYSLDGTGKVLMATEFKEYLVKRNLHFTENTGEADILDENNRPQKPDWCMYQKDQKDQEDRKVKGRYVNLVPGDSKPATKWKSKWINSSDAQEKRRADLVLQQIAKYMWLGKTRYGFVISEEELVPVRLSTFPKGSEAADLKDYERRQIEASRGQFLENSEEEEGQNGKDPEYQENPDIELYGNQTLGDIFSKPKNTTRTRLEYCSIPWAAHWAKNKKRGLTVNLVLWWLPMLAVQDRSIKERDDYVSLKEVTRDCRRIQDNEVDETQGDSTANPRKRKAGSSGRPPRGSKSSRGSASRGPAGPAASPRNGADHHDQNDGRGSTRRSICNQLHTPGRAPSARGGRSMKKNMGLPIDSSSSSAVSSPEAMDVDGYALSFPRKDN